MEGRLSDHGTVHIMVHIMVQSWYSDFPKKKVHPKGYCPWNRRTEFNPVNKYLAVMASSRPS